MISRIAGVVFRPHRVGVNGHRLNLRPSQADRTRKMKRLLSSARVFLADERGPTTVEYAVMLALMVAVVIGVVSALGLKTKAGLESVTSQDW